MTRLVGPDPDSRNPFAFDKDAAGRTVDMFTNAACTSLADVRTFNAATPSTVGAAIANSRVTLDSAGRLPRMWFPDGVTTLYARLVRGHQVATVVATARNALTNLVAGAAPAVAIGAGLGSSGNGAAVSVANATDFAGTLTITTASTGTAAGVLATLTLASPAGAAVKAVFFPKTAASAALAAYANTSTTVADLRTAATPAASTTYVFDYVIVG
jgi:hypothetical protein